jgi:Pregnancy-associated plasma protein-A/Secretion system C-terminal sorting domain
MPRLFLSLIAFILPLLSPAQSPENQKCGFQYILQLQESKTPGFQQEVKNYIQNILPQLAENATSRDLPAILRIPVVVHVIHFGEAVGIGRNISEDLIISQIDILNNDFRRMNADASQTPTEFLPFAADVEIEFCLAQINPQGNPTNGITRDQYGAIPSINFIENIVKPATSWNADVYLNIWSIDLPSNDLLGYSYLPTQTIVGTTSDGVVINYTNFGYINPSNSGRTAVHEVGHFLGILHPWGDDDNNGNPIGCSSDDGISDTPNSGVSYFDCPTQGFSCGSNDMYMNFMDYVDDDCMNLFTQGQKNAMRNILNGIRSELAESGSSLCPNSCNDISANAFNMGFESNQSFNSWEIENTNNDVTSWQFAQETSNDWGPNNGEGMAIYFWNNDAVTPADDYLFTPCFQIIENHAYKLTFNYACAKSGNEVFTEKLEIGFSDTQSSSDFYTLGSSWTLNSITNAYPDYNFKTFIFQSNANSTISIGFHAISDADKYALQIDDVKIEDLGSTVSNIEVENGSFFTVYPNPTSGLFVVEIDLEKVENLLEISLYDMLGRLIETKKVADIKRDQIYFDLSGKEPGMYILNLKGENIQYNEKILFSK